MKDLGPAKQILWMHISRDRSSGKLWFSQEKYIEKTLDRFNVAEYIVVTEGCKEMLWLQKFLQKLSLKQERHDLHCDSHSVIHLCKNPTFHSRSKHIDIKFHWIRDVLEFKLVKLDKVHTDENGADMMTKPFAKEKLHVWQNLTDMLEASK
ncbi:hypothetical protein CRG98_029422 [Punica granatum]|uniref:Reverse transcriptase Ty1/copia-type domain-containing protein n=1 Tax=Punica granatum TaxID=22663 RepID=A0A2I0J1R8_PUNGR|nr:hypothetical protein CRG98_029422 [Punica granatum]